MQSLLSLWKSVCECVCVRQTKRRLLKVGGSNASVDVNSPIHLLCFYTHCYTCTYRHPHTCCQESCADTIKPEKRFKQPPVMLLITVNLLCTMLHKAWRTSSVLNPSTPVTSAYSPPHNTHETITVYSSSYSIIATFAHSSSKCRITKSFVETSLQPRLNHPDSVLWRISYFHNM